MNLRLLLALSCAILSVGTSTLTSAVPIIKNVDPDHSSISPNGDGDSDSMIIYYDLADTAMSVYLLITEADSITTVDSLVTGIPQGPSGTHSATWDGTFGNGVPVPEGDYFIFLRAANAQTSDSIYVPISVDITPPQVIVTDHFPNPFAPGSPDPEQPNQMTIKYDASDAPPSDGIDVWVVIVSPVGTVVDTLLPVTGFPSNGSYTETWDGASAAIDGTHQVRITARDPAANVDVVYSAFNADLDAPDLEVTDPDDAMSFQTVPDSLFGWAWDRSGIDSLFVRYSGGKENFEAIQSTTLKMDTLFFAVQLSDTVVEQRMYSLGFRAVDNVGRDKVTLFQITLDSTPPATPILDQPASPTRNPTVIIGGTVDPGAETMSIIRNGIQVDSIFPNLPVAPQFPYELTLVPGENRVRALAIDKAGNKSDLSNEIIVTFDSSPGLVIGQPFRPDDSFQLNLAKPASSVTVRVYDMGGLLVESLHQPASGTSLAIPWNGLNGDREIVKKGPLVAVAQIRYQSGETEVFREIFLFQP